MWYLCDYIWAKYPVNYLGVGMSEKLKPCPFCGGEAYISNWCYKVMCVDCDAEVLVDERSTSSGLKEVSLKWNTRAPQSEWVSVDDRLPESSNGEWSKPVIALCDCGIVYHLSHFKGDEGDCWQRTSSFANNESSRVMYWMELNLPEEL
jgi:hypothetical protein